MRGFESTMSSGRIRGSSWGNGHRRQRNLAFPGGQRARDQAHGCDHARAGGFVPPDRETPQLGRVERQSFGLRLGVRAPITAAS